MTAPLQVIALSFSRGAGSEDRILAEVDRLRGRGVLRLLDMLFVGKSQDGTIERLTIGDDEDFGSLLAAVVPVANGGPAVPAPTDDPAAFDRAGAWALADSLQPGAAVAFLLVEHHWAAPLFDAIAETGGTLIGEGFLTAEAGLVVGAEVAAMEEASEVIAQAQAIEADALLTAAVARAEAAGAVAESERIQSAAAAGAVRALIAAGLVEEAAAHEAVTALTAAGLIVAAADQAAAAAVAEDAATVEGHSPSPSSPTSWASPGRQPRSERHVCTRGSASTAGTRRSAGPARSASSADSYWPREERRPSRLRSRRGCSASTGRRSPGRMPSSRPRRWMRWPVAGIRAGMPRAGRSRDRR